MPRRKNTAGRPQKPLRGQEEDGPGRIRITGPLTQAEIAAMFKCSKTNIYNIECAAMVKLRFAAMRDPELRDAMSYLAKFGE